MVVRQLPDLFGAALLPVPVFQPMNGGATPPAPLKVQVTLPVYLTVPGCPTPKQINQDLGTFYIQAPVIPVPQMAVFRRWDPPYVSGGSNTDLLISADPDTKQYLTTAESVSLSLNHAPAHLNMRND